MLQLVPLPPPLPTTPPVIDASVLAAIDAELTIKREIELAYDKLVSEVHAHRYKVRERIRELEQKRKAWVQ